MTHVVPWILGDQMTHQRARLAFTAGGQGQGIVHVGQWVQAGSPDTQSAWVALWEHACQSALDDPLPGSDAAQAAVGGWSRAVLLNQIKAEALGRTCAALTNFATQLPAPDSDLAQQLVKGPYVFDFLNLTQRVAERELEDALVANLQQFPLELGHGFAFVARQYRFAVAGGDFVIDLLFFNFLQNRFVVFELKVDKFTPAHAGQLGMYVSWVQQNLAQPGHREPIGILVCADRNAAVVHYALASATAPMAVSTYTYDQLPAQEQQALPSDTDLTTVIEHPVVRGRQMSLTEALAELCDHPSEGTP